MSQDLPTTTLKDSIATFMQGVSKQAPPEVLAGLGAEIRKLAMSAKASVLTLVKCMERVIPASSSTASINACGTSGESRPQAAMAAAHSAPLTVSTR